MTCSHHPAGSPALGGPARALRPAVNIALLANPTPARGGGPACCPRSWRGCGPAGTPSTWSPPAPARAWPSRAGRRSPTGAPWSPWAATAPCTSALQAVAGTGVPFGIVPAGTGNDFAAAARRARRHRRGAADAIAAGAGRPAPWTWPGSRAPTARRVVRGGAGGRVRRDRQRAGQPDAVAARAAAATTWRSSPSCSRCAPRGTRMSLDGVDARLRRRAGRGRQHRELRRRHADRAGRRPHRRPAGRGRRRAAEPADAAAAAGRRCTRAPTSTGPAGRRPTGRGPCELERRGDHRIRRRGADLPAPRDDRVCSGRVAPHD